MAPSVNTAPFGPPPPPRQSAKYRTTAVPTRTPNHKVVTEENVTFSQTAKIASGKDLSHTIHGETVLESTPNKKIALNLRAMHQKKTLKSPRPKISNPKSSKSKWHSIATIFTRTFLFFVMVTSLGSVVWNWTMNFSSPATIPTGGFQS
eukprot:Gb_37506 [translate_table: standard]